VGASTIQVTTGIIHYGYRIVEDMIEGLSDCMAERGIARVSDLVGKALPNLQTTDHFNLKRQGITQYDLDKCIGCGQCLIVCNDAAGQALEWDSEKRRPKLVEVLKLYDLQLCLPRTRNDYLQGNARGLETSGNPGYG
jgi:dihydropyrimidine dehydrogenase (NAD+) subunit PreA